MDETPALNFRPSSALLAELNGTPTDITDTSDAPSASACKDTADPQPVNSQPSLPDDEPRDGEDIMGDFSNADGQISPAAPTADAPTTDTPTTTAQNPALAPILQRPLRILAADDSSSLRIMVQRLLEKAGAQVTTAEDGVEAVETVLDAGRAGSSFDVVLMDMQMPKLNGRNAVSALRATGYRGIIIALTGNTDTFDAESCMQAGCNDYAAKPIRPRELIELILRVI